MTSVSVLVIGATGGTGKACIEQLGNSPSNPHIHAFCRDPSKLSADSTKFITTVQKGDARKPHDIETALANSGANWIIVSIGNGESVAKTNIREANAQATVSVLQKPAYQHVRVLVVSSTGAGTSKIVVGFGMGILISYHLRHVLADHTAQESEFRKLSSRVTVVRATALRDGASTGKLQQFGDREKSPTIKTDRKDLADWISQEVCEFGGSGTTVNVTSVKQ